MIKKAIPISWILILLIHHVTIAQQWTLTLGDKLERRDQIIEVPLSVDFSAVSGGVGSFDIYIDFDPQVLEYVDIINPALNGIQRNILEPGRLLIAWSRLSSGDTNPTSLNGKLLDLQFYYRGGETTVTFDEGQIIIGDSNANQIFNGTTDGGFIRELKQYEVTLTADPTSLQNNLSGGGTYWEGDRVDITALVPAGWTFYRWWWLSMSGQSVLEQSVWSAVNHFQMPSRDVWIEGEFREIPDDPVTLKLTVDGQGVVSINGDEYPEGYWELIFERDTTLTLVAAPDTQWVFEGWSGARTGTESPFDLILDKDTTLTATFNKPQPNYILNLNIEGEGSVLVNSIEYSMPTNVIPFFTTSPPPISLSALPDPGHRFIRWKGAGITGGQRTNPNIGFPLNQPSRTITAFFEEIPDSVTLTVNTAGNGYVTANGVPVTDSITVPFGDTLSLEAIPGDSLWVFGSWSGHVTGNNTQVTLIMDDDKSVTATFLERHLLTLLANPDDIGAELSGAGNYLQGELVNISASLPDAHTFAGWTAGNAADLALLDDPTSPATSFTMPGRAVTLTAKYEAIAPDQYNLTLLAQPNDIGAQLTGAGSYKQDEAISIAAGEVEGYEFTGWDGLETDLSLLDDSQAAETTLSMPDRDVALTATYRKIDTPPATYPLLLLAVPDDIEAPLYGQGAYEEGEPVTIVAGQVEGYQFVRWTGSTDDQALLDDTNLASASLVMPARPVTLIALYVLETPVEQYTLTITIIGNGQVNVDGEPYTQAITVDEGTPLSLQAIASEGWQFDDWSGSINSADLSVNVFMDEDKEITATFTEVEIEFVALTLNISGSGTVVLQGTQSHSQSTTIYFPPNTNVYLQAMPGQGWEFSGWDGDLSGTDDDFLLMDEDKVVTATFVEIVEPDVFTLTVDVVGNGEVHVNGELYLTPVVAPAGRTLLLQPFPGDGWQFDGWSGDHAGDEDMLLLTMDGDKNITAAFSEIPPPSYILTLNITGNGEVLVGGGRYEAGSHQIGPIEEGTSLPLQAIPSDGWDFDGWSGHLSGTDAAQTLLMNENKEVNAAFLELPPQFYTITFVVQTKSGILIPDATIVFNGTEYAPGEYQFEDLPPGTYSYLVKRQGFVDASGEATLVDADLEVVITLTADPGRGDFLSLYPNPTRSVITVESNQPFNELRVYNNIGQLMMTTSFQYTLLYTTDVRILANGLYYLRITTERDVRTGKFEVIH